MEKNSKYKLKSQARSTKALTPKDLHPLLVADIEYVPNPYKWPRRKKLLDVPVTLQIGLFDIDTQKFFRDLDEMEETHGQN
jgi:hypothetical protein